jgi:UDP-2-acetamido-2,6-beta-L-arabino-hexul-4-ose reductase
MGEMGRLVRVGITGQGGFMGGHLYNFLGTKLEEIKRISFKRNYFDDEVELQSFVKSCDVIVHIAAMNRHVDEQVLYNTNIGLVHKLVNACEVTKSIPKIIFSSSTQEEIDNLYGKSKRDGRKYFEDWATNNDGKVTSLVIPNVFGPFGRPFYNSFIATFSHQIVQGEQPKVINDSRVNLIYINELSEAFYNEIIKQDSENIQSYVVPHTSSRKVSEILGLLKYFKIQYLENNQVPKVDLNTFELDLFNTFTSFIPKDYFPIKFTNNTDERGAFVEIIGSDEVFEYILDGAEPAFVDMPIWYTHNIKNIGNTELITLFWINEPYNPEDADTYFIKV